MNKNKMKIHLKSCFTHKRTRFDVMVFNWIHVDFRNVVAVQYIAEKHIKPLHNYSLLPCSDSIWYTAVIKMCTHSVCYHIVKCTVHLFAIWDCSSPPVAMFQQVVYLFFSFHLHTQLIPFQQTSFPVLSILLKINLQIHTVACRHLSDSASVG